MGQRPRGRTRYRQGRWQGNPLPPLRSSFARYLDQVWQAAGGHSAISRNALAARIGIDPSLITRYLNGDRFPTTDTLARLADVLHLAGLERDTLYISAGFLPPDWEGIDPSALLIGAMAARVLGDQRIAAIDREQYAYVIAAMARTLVERADLED